MTSKLTFYFLLSTFYFLVPAPAASQWPAVPRADGPGPLQRDGPSARVERNEEYALEGADSRPRMVIARHQRRARLDDDVHRSSTRRIAARDRVRCGNGARALNVEVFKLSDGNLKNSKNSHASPTPILDGDRVYVHFGGDGTAALDAATGAIVWSKKFPYASQHGSGGSPALHGDLLIFSGDGHLEAWVIALDKRTGNVKWKTDRRRPFDQAYTTPLVISVDGRDQVVSVGAYRASRLRRRNRARNLARALRGRVLERTSPGLRAWTGLHHHWVLPARGAGRSAGWTGRRHDDPHRVVDDARRAVHAVAD